LISLNMRVSTGTTVLWYLKDQKQQQSSKLAWHFQERVNDLAGSEFLEFTMEV
jgi:hypothetical protein